MTSSARKAQGTTQTPNDGYTKLDFGLGAFFKFENVGDTIEGELLGIRDVSGQFGDQTVLDFKLADGTKVSVGVSRGLAGYPWADFKGQMVKLIYTGDIDSKKKGYHPCKTFDVFTKPLDVPFD